MHSQTLMWNVRKQKLKLTNKTEAQDNTSGQTLPPETETKRGQRGSGKARVQSAEPQEPNSVNKTTTGQGHRRTAGEENRAEAPGRNQPNNPTTTQATCAANSHLGKPKHPARKHMRQTNVGPTRGNHRRSLTNAETKIPTRKQIQKLQNSNHCKT